MYRYLLTNAMLNFYSPIGMIYTSEMLGTNYETDVAEKDMT